MGTMPEVTRGGGGGILKKTSAGQLLRSQYDRIQEALQMDNIIKRIL